MMKAIAIIFSTLLLTIIGCNPSVSESGFNINNHSKTLLGSDGAAEFFYWEFDESPGLWNNLFIQPLGIKRFADTLLHILGDLKYSEVVEKESIQSLLKTLILEETEGDKRNALMVHCDSIGHIRKINALEAQILNYQLMKYPLISHPTEFHAFIAYNQNSNKYRVYFGASDQPWPPRPELLRAQLDQDVKNGWQLKYHLHNHYESKSNNYLGILAPSLADAQYYKMLLENYNLETALITNGLHTVEIEARDFKKFDSH